MPSRFPTVPKSNDNIDAQSGDQVSIADIVSNIGGPNVNHEAQNVVTAVVEIPSIETKSDSSDNLVDGTSGVSVSSVSTDKVLTQAADIDVLSIETSKDVDSDIPIELQTPETVVSVSETHNLKRSRVANQQFKNFVTYQVTGGQQKNPINLTLTKALQKQDADCWWSAVLEELGGLQDLDVGAPILYEDISPDFEVIDTKFVLKEKVDALGIPTKYKARLVALGNQERFGPDVNLYSPTANDKSVKLFFAICAYLGLKIVGLDIYKAFITALIRRKVVIRLPKQLQRDGKSIYWRLKKTLYGLSDSPRIFNEELTDLLIAYGYKQSSADKCVFFKGSAQADIIIMVLIVDDFAVGFNSDLLFEELRSALKSKYTITESPSLESFIGIHICYNSDGSITLSMPGYIKSLCKRYLDPSVMPLQAPMVSDFSDQFQNDAPPCSKEMYQKLLGEIIFTLKVRIDVFTAVSILSQRNVAPTERDHSALLHILRYYLGTISHGITYHRCQQMNHFVVQMITWVDAAFNVHFDSKSQLGFCLSLGGHPDTGMIYASSCKSKTVALSSTEAETDAMVELTKNVVWFSMLLNELGFLLEGPALVNEDNASLITLVKNFSGNHKRVKHFLMKINYLIEQVNAKVIFPIKIHGLENCADALTKPLGPSQFRQILGKRST